ncbi:MAG: Dabb family protein [Chloroflexota bacterium]|nr:Dabb family protein [Chloroflexota bacterium]
MVEHMVVFQAKSGKEGEMSAALKEFASEIKQALPGIIELNVGENYSKRSLDQGWTHGLYARFQDRSVGEAYGPHPAHQKLLGKLGDLSAGAIPVDFEF